MKLTRTILVLVALAALFFVVQRAMGSGAEAALGSGGDGVPNLAELEASNGDGRYWDLPGVDGARARFRFSQNERELHAEWSKKGCAGEATADFDVGFIPTGLSALSDRELCVFGVDERSQDFIFEEWLFAGPAITASDDEGNCSVAAVELDSTRTLWRGARAEFHGLTSPRFVLPNHADPNLVFVVFASGSVQSLDRTTGEALTVASPIEGARPFVPALGFPGFNHAYSKTHKDLGHVYVLRSSGAPGPLLVLEDTDRDGSLDVFHEVSPAEWAELYARASFYE